VLSYTSAQLLFVCRRTGQIRLWFMAETSEWSTMLETWRTARRTSS